jgi:tRNA 2-selenouridine synthase
MNSEVSIELLLANRDAWQVVDVRSESEFAQGHIPGAINIPLFNDEERAKVGTLYKQVSPEAAMREGLAIAGTKMVDLSEAGRRAKRKTPRKMLIHCWRGGKRSQAMEWLLRFTGVEVYRLTGGYKSYRNEVNAFFLKNNFRFNIVGGNTGAGKTEVLQELAMLDEQVVDLEKLANHKGSAFGAIGEAEQPSTEQFENSLYTAMLPMNPRKPVWLENESKNIGRVYIPDPMWRKMRNSVLYHMEVDREVRLDRVMKYYSEPLDHALLRESFEKIQQRLGGLEYKAAINALAANDLRTAAGIALQYYDKSYDFQMSKWPSEKVVRINGCNDPREAAEKLVISKSIQVTVFNQ